MLLTALWSFVKKIVKNSNSIATMDHFSSVRAPWNLPQKYLLLSDVLYATHPTNRLLLVMLFSLLGIIFLIKFVIMKTGLNVKSIYNDYYLS